MILYLAATALVILFASRVPALRERTLFCDSAPRPYISRQVLTGKVLTAGIFLILFGLLALRINVGNDYAKYVEFMHLARFFAYVPTEIGFNLLSFLVFTACGEENFLICFAVIAAITVGCFLLAIDRLADSFFLSFSMFMLLGYYFQSFSTVRYYLALSVTTLAIVYLFRRDIPRFVLLVLFAATFHKSALVVLVLYPFAALSFSKWIFLIISAAGAVGLFFRSQVLYVMLRLYPTYQETTLAEGGEGSLVSIIRCAAVLLLVFFFDRKSFTGIKAAAEDPDKRQRCFYCHCTLLALVLYLCFSYLPVVSRIGYYLTITQIFYVPKLIRRIPSRIQRLLAAGLVAVFCLGFFVLMMRRAAGDGIRILPYQTFIFHDMPPILSDVGYN